MRRGEARKEQDAIRSLIVAITTALALGHPVHPQVQARVVAHPSPQPNGHLDGIRQQVDDRERSRTQRRPDVAHRIEQRLVHYTVSSTCYDQGSITASGRPVFLGEVANNFLPIGTRILLDHSAFGKRHFIVLDHIGWGSELDIYNSSEAACDEWGRREIGFWTLR